MSGWYERSWTSGPMIVWEAQDGYKGNVYLS